MSEQERRKKLSDKTTHFSMPTTVHLCNIDRSATLEGLPMAWTHFSNSHNTHS